MQIRLTGFENLKRFVKMIDLDKFDATACFLGPQPPYIGQEPHRARGLIFKFKGRHAAVVHNLQCFLGAGDLEMTGQEDQEQCHPSPNPADIHMDFLLVNGLGATCGQRADLTCAPAHRFQYHMMCKIKTLSGMRQDDGTNRGRMTLYRESGISGVEEIIQ